MSEIESEDKIELKSKRQRLIDSINSCNKKNKFLANNKLQNFQ